MGDQNLQVIEANLQSTLLLCSTAALINLSHTLHNTTISCKPHTALHTLFTAHSELHTALCCALRYTVYTAQRLVL